MNHQLNPYKNKVQKLQVQGMQYDIDVAKHWNQNDPDSTEFIKGRTHYIARTIIAEYQDDITEEYQLKLPRYTYVEGEDHTFDNSFLVRYEDLLKNADESNTFGIAWYSKEKVRAQSLTGRPVDSYILRELNNSEFVLPRNLSGAFESTTVEALYNPYAAGHGVSGEALPYRSLLLQLDLSVITKEVANQDGSKEDVKFLKVALRKNSTVETYIETGVIQGIYFKIYKQEFKKLDSHFLKVDDEPSYGSINPISSNYAAKLNNDLIIQAKRTALVIGGESFETRVDEQGHLYWEGKDTNDIDVQLRFDATSQIETTTATLIPANGLSEQELAEQLVIKKVNGEEILSVEAPVVDATYWIAAVRLVSGKEAISDHYEYLDIRLTREESLAIAPLAPLRNLEFKKYYIVNSLDYITADNEINMDVVIATLELSSTSSKIDYWMLYYPDTKTIIPVETLLEVSARLTATNDRLTEAIENVDDKLTTAIEDEVTARENADTQLLTNLENLDTKLSNELKTEADTRELEDNALQTKIDNLNTNVKNTFNNLLQVSPEPVTTYADGTATLKLIINPTFETDI